jgi:hypothetical protein
LIKTGRYELPLQLDLGNLIKIKAGSARHANNMGSAIAKPAFIFVGNAEVDYFRLK